MGASGHIAAHSLAGYQWQVRRAFLALLTGDFGQTVEIESVDDYSISSGGQPIVLVQTKHSFAGGDIGKRSVAWWKSLRVWLDHAKNGSLPANCGLQLTTTATVASDLAVELSGAQADPVVTTKLRKELDVIASAGGSVALAKAHAAWLAASSGVRESILRRIVITAEQPDLAGVHATIQNELRRFGVPDGESLRAIRERLIGWFQTQLEERLAPAGAVITYDELNVELTDCRSYFNPTKLPVLHATAPTPSLENESASMPQYLRQLTILQANDRELRAAVDMFHRAVLERDHWMNSRITAHASLRAFDDDLVNTWGGKQLKFERTMSDQNEQSRGFSLYYECMDHRGAIGGVTPPPHVANGSFHMLANERSDRLQIGWHPRFRELLEEPA